MKKYFLFILVLLVTIIGHAQIGIGTTSPESTLDIRSSNQATPSNDDGILIPKVDEFPVVNPTASKDGLMVYVTGTGTPSKGFYYWDQTTTAWVNIKGAEKIDDLIDGKSDNDGTDNGSSIFLGIDAGINDDGTNNFNLGIGFQSLQNNTTGRANIGVGYQSLNQNSIGSFNTAVGQNSLGGNTTASFNTGFGNSALINNETGQANTALGTNALQNNIDGDSNVAVGNAALFNNTADFNNAVGSFALHRNTSGIQNTAMGYTAQYLNVTGSNNTAVGYESLRQNTGSNNTAFGSHALRNTISGNNVAIGSNAAFSQVGGVWNVAIGSNALYTNTESSANVAIGFEALYANTGNINNGNIAIGHQALRNVNSSYNIGIGLDALSNNTGVGANLALGANSLVNNVMGGGNVAIGHSAGSSNNGSNNVFLGLSSGANETGSNKLYIENSNADANNALIYGDFDTNFVRLNGRTEITSTTDASGIAGTGALEIGNTLRIDGNEIITNTNATLFVQADNNGDLDVDGSTFRVDASTNRVGIRTNSPDSPLSVNGEANLNENIAAGVALRVNGSEALWYNGTYFSWGFGGTANYFADYIGIGTSTPDTALQIEGGTDVSPSGGGFIMLGAANGWNIAIDDNEIMARNNGVVSDLNLQAEGGNVRVGGAIVHASDRRLKKDIEDLTYGLNEILNINPKQYNWKNRDVGHSKSFGLIAQDIQEIIPELVINNEDEIQTLSVNYTELIPILINAVKEQDKKIENLETQLNYYKKLEERILALEMNSN